MWVNTFKTQSGPGSQPGDVELREKKSASLPLGSEFIAVV